VRTVSTTTCKTTSVLPHPVKSNLKRLAAERAGGFGRDRRHDCRASHAADRWTTCLVLQIFALLTGEPVSRERGEAEEGA